MRYYKVDPFTMFQNMTMLDFQNTMRILEDQNRKEREDKQGDKLMRGLIIIRDTLNYMTLPER